MNRFLTNTLLVILTGAGLAGCYPGGPDYTSDLDVVYTNHEAGFDFQQRNTYAMPDEIIIDVDINRGDTTYEYMASKYADPILSRIDANMASLGWQKVDIGADPDLLLAPAGLSTTSYYYSYWYGWWYGGYYPGWGWYYPPTYTVSSYTTGSLIMVLADPKDDNPINKSAAAWVGVVNGLLTSSTDINRVFNGIDQAFEQSAYLKTN